MTYLFLNGKSNRRMSPDVQKTVKLLKIIAVGPTVKKDIKIACAGYYQYLCTNIFFDQQK